VLTSGGTSPELHYNKTKTKIQFFLSFLRDVTRDNLIGVIEKSKISLRRCNFQIVVGQLFAFMRDGQLFIRFSLEKEIRRKKKKKKKKK
jgi:hypothetical protein